MHSLVGRAFELAQLERALADASSGRGRLVLVAGEPGIGKSRLVDEAARRTKMRVVWGRCWEAGGAPPFWPWIQILRSLQRDAPTVAVPSELARLLPEVGTAIDGAARPVVEERFLLFDAIHRYIGEVALAQPVVSVIEDLHAADLASLQVLAFVASHLQGSAVAVIGTYRTSEARTTPEVGALIGKLGRDAETIAPRRLTLDAIRELAAEAGVTDANLVAAIERASEGNPLFVRELVKLGDRGQLAIPDTVRSAIREHLARLPASARAVANCAAVIGGEIVTPNLAQLVELDERALGVELSTLVDHGVVVERGAGRLAFAHGLFVETLHHDLDVGERERLHGRAADALAPTATSAEVTRHLFDAGASRRGQAIEAARGAADEAIRQLAFDEASSLLARALAVVPDDKELRFELALALGTAQIHAGAQHAGLAMCLGAAELARSLDDGRRLARAATAYGLVLTIGQTDPALVALIEEALAKIPPGDSAECARLLARLAGAKQPTFDPMAPIATARKAIEMARRIGEPRLVLEVLYTAISALQNFAHPDERRTLSREVIGLATRLREPNMILRSHYRLVLDHLCLGDLTTAMAHAGAYDETSRDMRQPHVRWLGAAMRSLFALHTGRLAAARAEFDEATRLHVEGGGSPAWTAGLRMTSLLTIGDDATLIAERAQYARFFAGSFTMYARLGAAILAVIAEDREGARAELARFTADQVLTFGDLWMYSWTAKVVVYVGDRAFARSLYDGIAPHAHLWCCAGAPTLTIEPSVNYPRALLAAFLGLRDEARSHFATVIAELRAAGLPVLLARTLVEWVDSGLPAADEATRALDEARELATRIGLPLLGRIQRLVGSRATRADSLELVRDGDTWRVARAGVVCRVKHGRGIELLARLVAEPTRELHVLDLVGAEVVDAGDAGETLDREAITAYRKRALELREEIEEADAMSNAARRERALGELEAIQDQLSGGVGLGNRQRRTGAAAEKARVNVQRRITDAIKRIAELAPELGQHLHATVRTGTACSYDPRRAPR